VETAFEMRSLTRCAMLISHSHQVLYHRDQHQRLKFDGQLLRESYTGRGSKERNTSVYTSHYSTCDTGDVAPTTSLALLRTSF